MAQPLCLRRPTLRVLCVRARLARSILAPGRQARARRRRHAGRHRCSAAARAGADRPGLEIVRPTALFERLAHHPKIGIGEAYMAGDWRAAEGTDLAELLMPFAERMTTAVPPRAGCGCAASSTAASRASRTTRCSARAATSRRTTTCRNDLFAAFLDETMSYSSALFDEDQPLRTQSFEEAQLRKVARDPRHGQGRPGQPRPRDRHRLGHARDRGGPAWRDASRRVTLSTEQAALARRRVADAGLRRHRRHPAPGLPRGRAAVYDAIVSVEMIEAVGEEYWETYFRTIDERLAPGGVAAVQAILMSHDRLMATKHSYGWIQKHIFPGGLIPRLQAIERDDRRRTRACA